MRILRVCDKIHIVFSAAARCGGIHEKHQEDIMNLIATSHSLKENHDKCHLPAELGNKWFEPAAYSNILYYAHSSQRHEAGVTKTCCLWLWVSNTSTSRRLRRNRRVCIAWNQARISKFVQMQSIVNSRSAHGCYQVSPGAASTVAVLGIQAITRYFYLGACIIMLSKIWPRP